MNVLQFFYDPVLRAPTIGSMLMCLAAALVGVVVFVRKRSLLGEALSHATYPGVTFAIIIASLFSVDRALPLLILLSAAFSALVGFLLIEFLEKKMRVSSDAALCFVLALFFGTGITVASYTQNSFSHLYQQIQGYLYGQAATMTDRYIVLYALFALIVIGVLTLFYKEIVLASFDRTFAKASGISTRLVEALFFTLVIFAVVIGIRSVGVILMSAMLIAPASAARQFTNRLPRLFVLAALFGVGSAFLGTYFSVQYHLPTGPSIVLFAGTIACYALLFAPKRGLILRYYRASQFRAQQGRENLLKLMWRNAQVPLSTPHEVVSRKLARTLNKEGYIEKRGSDYILTPSGVKRGGQIVRLHRLWELYLVNNLGLGTERVHASAEEMEHILTPELEQKLTRLLDNPKHDPHAQPIPSREEVMPYG